MGRVLERQIKRASSILSSLFKTHGTSLNDELLGTLLIEVEAIVNSSPLTTNLLNDVNSMIPHSPINLLTLKPRIVMLAPGVFTAPDIYGCNHNWRKVLYICNEFWSRWRKEFFATLHCREKWSTITRKSKVGDFFLLREVPAEWSSWLIPKIVATNADKNGFVRSAKLIVGASGATDMVLWYHEWPVKPGGKQMTTMMVWVRFHGGEPFHEWLG